MKALRALAFACLLMPWAIHADLPPFKQRFIASMLKAVRTANHAIRLDRARIIRLSHKAHRDAGDRVWLHGMAITYAMPYKGRATPRVWRRFLLRVNAIPASLAIAQAINESNWGRSSFARSAQNYFGIWCYQVGCGVVPAARAPGRRYEVRVFPSMDASVAFYMHLLNTKGAYAALREMRETASQQGRLISGSQLALALGHYSARGASYVKSIRRIIQQYGLHHFDARVCLAAGVNCSEPITIPRG